MSLASYVHAMGRGPSRGRSLTRAEAADAMRQILAGTAAREAVGALLMLMRYRGETADEVAGFTDAAREGIAVWRDVGAAVDWPSYAAGRSRGLPWFLLAALLVAQAGHPVFLHGWNSHQRSGADVRAALAKLKIPVAEAPDVARAALSRHGIVYAPLMALHPDLLRILRLRDVLGLRSAVNTVCRMLNPSESETVVQGVFHPSYRTLQQDAGQILGQRNLIVIKGGGGEFERHPAKRCTAFGLSDGDPFEFTTKALSHDHRRLSDGEQDPGHLEAVWTGDQTDPWAEKIVIGTAAMALDAVDPETDLQTALEKARSLWRDRYRDMAA